MVARFNAKIRHLGVSLVKGRGYFYWLDANGFPLDGRHNVNVCRFGDLTLPVWFDLALEVSRATR